MSRIHFEYGDLLRVKLATRRVPLIDLWLMLAAAQRRTSNLLFQQRQRQLRSGVTREALPLLALAAETGSVPDFLSPPTEDFDTGLEMIRSTPRTVVRRQLEQTFPRESRCPGLDPGPG